MPHRIFALTLAFLAAGPLHALSCIAPDTVRLFEEARDSEDVYLFLKGQVTPIGTINQPKPERRGNGEATSRVMVTGMGLSTTGFNVPVDQEIDLTLYCLSVWCGSAPAKGQDFIMAIQLIEGRQVLTLGPCQANAIPLTEENEERLLNCYLKGDCQPGF